MYLNARTAVAAKHAETMNVQLCLVMGLSCKGESFVPGYDRDIALLSQVLTMVLSVGMVAYFYFFSLVPFLLHSRKVGGEVLQSACVVHAWTVKRGSMAGR